jgi:hypothetical protein
VGLNPRHVGILISASVASVVLLGLPDFDRRDYHRLYERVQLGMTVAQVQAVAGRPDDMLRMPTLTSAFYDNDQIFPGIFSRDRKELIVVYRGDRVMYVDLTLGSGSKSKPQLEPNPISLP